jgi:hypothetical protein
MEWTNQGPYSEEEEPPREAVGVEQVAGEEETGV